jgi:hypothetical protein
MLGNMLSYPFALLRRKPATVLGAFFVYTLFLVGLDVAFAAMGQDLLSADADLFGSSRGAYQGYSFLASLGGLGVSALVMGAALIDLKRRRPEDRPSAFEGAKFFILNTKFGIMVVAPFALLALLVVGGVGYFFQGMQAWPIGLALMALPIALALLFVSIRLYLAWPRALASDDIHLLRAWPLTEGKFWPTFGLFLAAHAVGIAPVIAFTSLAELLGLLVWYPTDSLAAVLTPDALGYSGGLNTATAFATVYLAITPAFMFDALDPIKPDVAEVF